MSQEGHPRPAGMFVSFYSYHLNLMDTKYNALRYLKIRSPALLRLHKRLPMATSPEVLSIGLLFLSKNGVYYYDFVALMVIDDVVKLCNSRNMPLFLQASSWPIYLYKPKSYDAIYVALRPEGAPNASLVADHGHERT
jgi:hypothetical protein